MDPRAVTAATTPEGLLADRRLARRVSVSVAIRLAGRVATMAAGAASIVLLTRYLSMADYGYYVTATTIGTFVAVIVDGGITGIAIRESAKFPDRQADLAAAATGARILVSLGAIAIGLLFVQMSYDGRELDAVRVGVLLVSVTLPLGALTAGCQVVGESTVRVGRLVAADALARIVAVGVLAVAVATRLGYAGVYLPLVAGGVLSTVVLLWTYRRVAPLRITIDRSLLPLLGAAVPLGLALILNALYFRVDAVLLSLLRSPSDVAIYGLAYRCLEIALSLGGFLLAGLLPVMSAATAQPQRWTSIADRTFTFLLAVGLGVAGCGWVVAGGVTSLLAGGGYENAGRTLSILLLGAALSWINGFGGLLLISVNKQRQTLWLNVLALTANVIANIAVIPHYGYIGAAWVTVASELVNFAGMVFLVRRLAGYRWRLRQLPQVGTVTVLVVGLSVALHAVSAPLLVELVVPAGAWLVTAHRLALLPTSLWRAPRPTEEPTRS